jgi:hypothetical protein
MMGGDDKARKDQRRVKLRENKQWYYERNRERGRGREKQSPLSTS